MVEDPNQLQAYFKQQQQQQQPQEQPQEPQQQPQQQKPQQQPQQQPQPQPQNQSIQFEDADQPDQFEGFGLVEPQTEPEQQQEQQQQQEQLENDCFIQECDQTITGRLLSYSR